MLKDVSTQGRGSAVTRMYCSIFIPLTVELLSGKLVKHFRKKFLVSDVVLKSLTLKVLWKMKQETL